MSDAATMKSRLTNQITEMSRQLEDSEQAVANLTRLKQQMNSQLEEARNQANDEARVSHSLLDCFRFYFKIILRYVF